MLATLLSSLSTPKSLFPLAFIYIGLGVLSTLLSTVQFRLSAEDFPFYKQLNPFFILFMQFASNYTMCSLLLPSSHKLEPMNIFPAFANLVVQFTYFYPLSCLLYENYNNISILFGLTIQYAIDCVETVEHKHVLAFIVMLVALAASHTTDGFSFYVPFILLMFSNGFSSASYVSYLKKCKVDFTVYYRDLNFFGALMLAPFVSDLSNIFISNYPYLLFLLLLVIVSFLDVLQLYVFYQVKNILEGHHLLALKSVPIIMIDILAALILPERSEHTFVTIIGRAIFMIVPLGMLDEYLPNSRKSDEYPLTVIG